MDTIFIEGLTLEATIGCLPWERQIKQKVIFDISMQPASSRAGQTDALKDALDYAAVSERVRELVIQSQFQLIEALAENIATAILTEFPCIGVKIRLQKPGAVALAKSVGVLIERSR